MMNLNAESYNVGERLDIFLSTQLSDQSRASIQKFIVNGSIIVNGKTVTKNYKIRMNDIILVTIPEPVGLEITAQNIPLEIAFEDDYLLVINKPKGMVVHPAAGNYDGTLVNALMYHCKESLSGINGVVRPGIVHRIDKDTSGLLIVAKNDKAHVSLAKQIKEHSFLREYEAVVLGNVKLNNGTIDLPIGRHKVDRKKMCVTNHNARNATTHYTVIERYSGYTHLMLRLETGRTHQIRVHMAYMGHPVAGDTVYGHKKPIKSLQGQCLHARTIGFVHPITGEDIYIKSDLPEYFNAFLKSISEVKISE